MTNISMGAQRPLPAADNDSFVRKFTPARMARKIWKMFHGRKADAISYQGFILPHRRLRGKMCGESFLSEEFFFQSGVAEARRLATTLAYTGTGNLVDIGSGLGRLALGLLWE